MDYYGNNPFIPHSRCTKAVQQRVRLYTVAFLNHAFKRILFATKCKLKPFNYSKHLIFIFIIYFCIEFVNSFLKCLLGVFLLKKHFLSTAFALFNN